VTDRILVACIGNIFFGDDGFGVEVARALFRVNLPDNVHVVDYGIRGLDLTYALLEPWKAVIFVDAVTRGERPGTLYLLEPLASSAVRASLDPHALNPVQVLAAARSLGPVKAEICIVACEPHDLGDELEGRMGLSSEVEAAVPEAVKMVLERVALLQESKQAVGVRE
jgi:hydrogenase maturation protease